MNKIQATTSAVVLSALLASPAAFANFDKFVKELKSSGKKENLSLTVAIDYTGSNLDNGQNTYRSSNLHNLEGANDNPYQQTLKAIGQTLLQIDGNHHIPLFGFGDSVSKGTGYFVMHQGCENAEEALEIYRQVTPKVTFSGPTNFAPVIRGTIQAYKQSGELQVLLIITDGAVAGQVKYPDRSSPIDADEDTQNAIIEASQYPISIIAVGVGDGDQGHFGTLEKYDDELKKKGGSQFDNFQFVKYSKFLKTSGLIHKTHYFDAKGFAEKALEELPKQFKAMKKLGIYK